MEASSCIPVQMCGILHYEMAEESPCLELLVDVCDSEPLEGRGLADPLQSWPGPGRGLHNAGQIKGSHYNPANPLHSKRNSEPGNRFEDEHLGWRIFGSVWAGKALQG